MYLYMSVPAPWKITVFDKMSKNEYCKFKANKVRFKAITSVKMKNTVFGM